MQRLTAAVNPSGADEAYTYDFLGNRLTAAGVPGTWNYNANNELEGYGNVAFAYDDNGNTIRKTSGVSETNYSYDVEDQLVQVKDGLGAEIATYFYDPFGRRLYKEVDGQRTYFVYSNEGLIGEYDESGAEIRAYGWVPDSQWSTDPLFYKQQGQYYWYTNDHLGTPQKIISTSGRVVWSAAYDSFGNCQVQTAEIVNNLRFAGQYYDHETGLYYNLNRYYDANTGRYLRIDPYREGLNLFAYVFNNPVSQIDALGLCSSKKDNINQAMIVDLEKIFPGIFNLHMPTTGYRYWDNLIISIGEPIVDSYIKDSIFRNSLMLWERTQPYVWIYDMYSRPELIIGIWNNLEQHFENPEKKIQEYEKFFKDHIKKQNKYPKIHINLA